MVCGYPNDTNYQLIEQSKDYIHHYNTRVYMQSTLVDEKGEENYIDNFYNCYKYNLPCLTLKNYKLYICPFQAHVIHYYKKCNKEIPVFQEDTLDIRDIKNNLDILQTFCFTPKKMCKYCKRNSNTWIWHKSDRDIIEFNTPLSELYFSDYPRYERIINQGRDYLLKIINSNVGPIDNFGNYQFIKDKVRYGFGKIDIIIPYYYITKN